MIYLASDHRGFELKSKIKVWLSEWGYEPEDLGAFEFNQDDDYPDFVKKAAEKVSQKPDVDKGIVLGATGQGEAITANRFKDIRAGVFYGGNMEIIRLSREHNNSNILSLAASYLDEDTAKKAVKLWLETGFSNEERHARRLAKLD